MQFTGIERLEDTIRNAARRVALAIAAGACIVGMGFTADETRGRMLGADHARDVGAILTVGLLVDLFLRRS